MKPLLIPKITDRKKKRLGHGYGSGKGGHTSSRGAKGQKARGKIKSWFEGGQLSIIRRLPKIRGKGIFKPLKSSPLIINLKDIAHLKTGTLVNQSTLVSEGIINSTDATQFGIKILGHGEIKVALKIGLPISKLAAEKIKKAGGEIE
jgi:large subunit ribosomal protein L15